MRMTKEYALKRAREVVAMLGQGWKVRVWENDGWHWEVSALDRCLTVHESTFANRGFWCLFSTTHPGAGDCRWTMNGEVYPTPREAVIAQLRLVREAITQEVGVFLQTLDVVDKLENPKPPKARSLRRKIADILDTYGESFICDDGVDQRVVNEAAGEIIKAIKEG